MSHEEGSVTDTETGEVIGSYRSIGPIYLWRNKHLGWGFTFSSDVAWAKIHYEDAA